MAARYEILKNLKDEQFRRLTGVKRHTFNRMLEILSEAFQRKMASGGRRSRLSVADMLLLALEYIREYRTSFSNGKRHDFRLFKESKAHIHPETTAIVDTGYQGLQRLHPKTRIPKKRSKKNPLMPADKAFNRALASDRVFNENVIALIKRFKIIGDRYRNRRKRFCLRFNLISGIYNFEVDVPTICE